MVLIITRGTYKESLICIIYGIIVLKQNYPDNDTYFHNENNSWQQCFVMKKIALLITDRV